MPFSIENGSKINLKGPTDHWRGSLVGFALPDSILAGINSLHILLSRSILGSIFIFPALLPRPPVGRGSGHLPTVAELPNWGRSRLERSLILSHQLVNIELRRQASSIG